MATFQFDLVSPERLLMSEAVDQVVLPGAEGEMTVLADHAPVMSLLKPGVVDVHKGGTVERIFVRGGFADISPAGLNILAEQAMPLAEVDAATLDKEIKDAEEDHDDAPEGDAKVAAAFKLAQLRDLKAALGR